MFCADFFGFVSDEWIAIGLLALCIVPIVALMVTAIIIWVKRVVLKNKKRNESIKEEDIDFLQQKLFFDAYGGKENITKIEKETSRLIVSVIDIDKVLPTVIKDELGAKNVLLAGLSVKSSFGDRIDYIYKLLTSTEGVEKNDSK